LSAESERVKLEKPVPTNKNWKLQINNMSRNVVGATSIKAFLICIDVLLLETFVP